MSDVRRTRRTVARRDRIGQTELHASPANGVDFAYLAAGDDGPLALCLHGFPDSAHTLAPPAARARRAPATARWRRSMRGYAPTAVAGRRPLPDRRRWRPTRSRCTRRSAATRPRCDHRPRLGRDARRTAPRCSRPSDGRRSSTMAVPPGGAMGRGVRRATPTQLKRSWYMFFFQHGLADLVVPANDLAFIDMIWARLVAGLRRRRSDLAHVKDCAARPGQPRRRARLLPGDVRRRSRRTRRSPTRRQRRRRGAAAAARCTCTVATTAASASRSPSDARDASSADNVDDRDRRRRRSLPAARTARRRQRTDPGVPRHEHASPPSPHPSCPTASSSSSRRSARRAGWSRRCSPRSRRATLTVYTQDDPSFPAGVAADPRRRPRRSAGTTTSRPCRR